jgi:hypothetical protein
MGGTACTTTQCDLDADFGYQPASNNSISGIIFYNTASATDNVDYQSGADTPYPGIPVYLWDCGSGTCVLMSTAFTDSSGNYTFAGMPNGTYQVSVDKNAPALVDTTQSFDPNATCPTCDNLTQQHVLSGGAPVTGQNFGFYQTPGSQLDCGDLSEAPEGFNTTFAREGACHVIGSLYLGNGVPDSDANGQPSTDAIGDDADGTDDEDGVNHVPNEFWLSNTTVNIDITVGGGNGFVVGWFDWNNDGIFGSGEMITFGSLSPGTHRLPVTIPSSYGTSLALNARFRVYDGAPSLLAPSGQVTNGEVEDYHWFFGPNAVNLQSFSAFGSTTPPGWIAVMLLPMLLIGGWLLKTKRRNNR